MHEHIPTSKQHPTQKFNKNLKSFQKPQKFQENPKPRSKCVKCMKNEGLRDHTREETQDLGRNPSGEGERVEGKVFGKGEKKFLSRRNEKE